MGWFLARENCRNCTRPAFLKRLTHTKLPSKLIKDVLGELDVHLNLLSSVEVTGTSITGAHNISVESAVDPLGFGPELGISELGFPENTELLKVDLGLLGNAVLAQIAHTLLDRGLAAHALGLLGCKHHQTAFSSCRRGDKYLAGVITLEQSLVNILNDGLEDSRKRLGKLIGQVPLAIDRDIILKDVNGVLGLFEVRSSLDTRDDNVRDTITHLRR